MTTITNVLSREQTKMLGPQEVADLMSIGRRTFYRYRSQGLIPPPDFERGKVIRWWPSTIYRWLNAKDAEVSNGA